MKPLIISEIGWNFIENIDLAKSMILTSKLNGADFVKTQIFSVKRLQNGDWDKDGRRQIYEKAELNFEKYKELFEFAQKNGVFLFASVFSIPDAEILAEVCTKRVKIPSYELANIELIKYCNNIFDELIISTGASTIDEIAKTISYVDSEKLTLMHCVSSYPLNSEYANLERIWKLKKFSTRIGYSDHCTGIEIAKIACEYGICMIEKHFTLSHELPGRDNKFAILPHEMKNLANYLSIRQELKTLKTNDFQMCELEIRNARGKFDK